MIIPEFLRPFFIAWFFTTNEPIQDALARFFGKLNDKIPSLIFLLDPLYTVLSCPYCLTFWLTLVWICNLWTALAMSFVMWVIKRFIFKF